MKDTIYRSDAIEAVEAVRELLSVEAHCAITERISALPSAEADVYEDYEHATLVDIKAPLRASAEAVQGWIPCIEKLPSESGWYVISVVGLKNITDVSYFYSDESKWSDVSHTQTVTAWMPLPTPYKGGDDDD